jgi:hypothetical protein
MPPQFLVLKRDRSAAAVFLRDHAVDVADADPIGIGEDRLRYKHRKCSSGIIPFAKQRSADSDDGRALGNRGC